MANPIALRFDHVDKRFRTFGSAAHRLGASLWSSASARHSSVTVLDDVTFDIPRGQSVAVIGANGVGKSTLLHLAAGLIEPSAGTVETSGRVSALLDLGGTFLPDLTGRENARFFHDVVSRGAGDAKARERGVEEFAEIGEYFDRPVRTYSSGMFLRLAFACAAAEDPDILLIDEVLTVGDARFQQKCHHRLTELRARGTTVVMVTHVVEPLPSICDRVLVLEHGRVVFDGLPRPAIERYYQLFFMAPERPATGDSGRELRYGVGGAAISHVSATHGGGTETREFTAGEQVTVAFDVEFSTDVASPQFGFACTTTEGVRISATTSAMLGMTAHPACRGERRRVEVTFRLDVAVPDVFVDLSVFEASGGAVSVFDARIAALHLVVATTHRTAGISDLGVDMRSAIIAAPLQP